MTLILHIGLYKTATTFLQAQLWHNRLALLKNGILFVPEMYNFFRNFTSHTPASEQLMDAAWLALYKLSGARSKSGKLIESVLISCEALCYPQNPSVMVEQLEAAVAPFQTVKIILCVRRQDTYMESTYAQNVKQGQERKTFQDGYAMANMDTFDWYRLSREWDVFSSLCVYPYEIHKKASLAKHFFSKFTDLDPDIKDEHINPTPTKYAVEKILKINNSDPSKTQALLREAIISANPKPIGVNESFFTKEQRMEALNRLAESNKKLFESYMKEYVDYLPYYQGETNVL